MLNCGIAAVLCGLLALFVPGLTLRALIAFFGAYALVDGVFAIVAAARGIGQRCSFGQPLIEGIVGILAGLLTFVYPGLTALVLLYFIAARAIVTCLAKIAGAIELRRVIPREWLLILGVVAYVVFGVLLIGLGLRLRTMEQRLEREAPKMRPAL